MVTVEGVPAAAATVDGRAGIRLPGVRVVLAAQRDRGVGHDLDGHGVVGGLAQEFGLAEADRRRWRSLPTGLMGTAMIAHQPAELAVQFMLRELEDACLVLAPPMALELLEAAYPLTLHNWLWLASGVSVVPEALTPLNTLSKMSSVPKREVKLAVTAVVVLFDDAAPTAVPRGVVWSTFEKLAAPATIPLLTLPEKVTPRLPACPLRSAD